MVVTFFIKGCARASSHAVAHVVTGVRIPCRGVQHIEYAKFTFQRSISWVGAGSMGKPDLTTDSGRMAALASDLELACIYVVAVFFDGGLSARNSWWEACRAAHVLTTTAKPMTALQFKDRLHALVALGAVLNPEARGFYTLNIVWRPAVLQLLEASGRLGQIAQLVDAQCQGHRYMRGGDTLPERIARALAIGHAEGIARALSPLYLSDYNSNSRYPREHLLVAALGVAPLASWVARLPVGYRDMYVEAALTLGLYALQPPSQELFAHGAASTEPNVLAKVALAYALMGDTEAASQLVAQIPRASVWHSALTAIVALVMQDVPGARAALRTNGKSKRTSALRVFPALDGVVAILVTLLIATDDAYLDRVAFAEEIVRKSGFPLRLWPRAPGYLLQLAELGLPPTLREERYVHQSISWAESLLEAIALRWTVSESQLQKITPSGMSAALAAYAKHAASAGYAWLAVQLNELAQPDNSSATLIQLKSMTEYWETVLSALDAQAPAVAATPVASAAPLVWRLGYEPRNKQLTISCAEVNARSRTGKAVSLTRLAGGQPGIGSTADQLLGATLHAARRTLGYFPSALLRHFVGREGLQDAAGSPLQVLREPPELQIAPAADGVRLTMSVVDFDADGLAITNGPGTLTLIEVNDRVAAVQRAIGSAGLLVPAAGAARLARTIAGLSTEFTILNSASSETATRQGLFAPCVQLFRGRGGEFRVRVRVRPFAESEQTFRPGVPPAEVVLTQDAQLLRGVRDLVAEHAAAADLETSVPSLAVLSQVGEDRVIRDLPTCLELLLELAAAEVVVEWPEGQSLRAPKLCTQRDIRINVRGNGKWFQLEGALQVDADNVLNMQALLAATTQGVGRFLRITEDQYIALAQDVAGKVAALARAQALSTKAGLAAALLPAVAELTNGLQVTYTKAVAARKQALDTALRESPKVPRTLKAELRDYQRDGFVFMARLAAAGLGAILADDMGLGKTVQALALLLHRSKLGPALVVAPTSVARNWQLECVKFAPTLQVLRMDVGDRASMLEAAGPGDVVLVSYGLLVTEQAGLAAKRFATVVFDEAHALKNAATKRAACARTLLCDAAIALTGTPVENHVTELHALLDVVVPGVLGSRSAFSSAFIANDAAEQRAALATLRGLVRPLVLRRSKTEVLTELPPKTEMTRLIPASPEHRAFYEAVRQRAAAAAAASRVKGAKVGNAHIQILAEITRLRRAAIDPRLVAGASAPHGGKFEVLADMVTDLRSEGHSVLIFSQFLEVLDYAGAALKAADIRCLRLDGTMAAGARASAIAEFQSGDADAFLLSLKAGGVGLNLTGADYVIHLDPWWNPAVEDQASDRAHRIGQTRPVTVVRLVTEGTIEEKVLALHGAKREMYQAVVGEADGKGSLDVALLVELLSAT
jgi:superfamily II DNA or RNA helicase